MFKVGERVQMKCNRDWLNTGDKGTVCLLHDGDIGVDWDKDTAEGHECSEHGHDTARRKHGWYVDPFQIEYITQYKSPMSPKMRCAAWKICNSSSCKHISEHEYGDSCDRTCSDTGDRVSCMVIKEERDNSPRKAVELCLSTKRLFR